MVKHCTYKKVDVISAIIEHLKLSNSSVDLTQELSESADWTMSKFSKQATSTSTQNVLQNATATKEHN